MFKFTYGITYKYKWQLSHSTDRHHVVVKFQLSEVNNIVIGFKKMPIDYNDCYYISPDSEMNKKHAKLWSEFQNGQVQYNSFSSLQDLQMKYMNTYKDSITNLYIYINAICIPSTCYLLISLTPQSQLNEMTTQVKEAVNTSNPEYGIVSNRLHLYCDMKLVIFGISDDSDLITLFLQPIANPCYLYQIEIVLDPIVDKYT